MAVTQVGELKRARFTALAALVVSGVVVAGSACSGEPFCGDSRTCPSEPSTAAGQAGAPASNSSAGAGADNDSAGQGGATSGGSSTSHASAGDGGDPATPDCNAKCPAGLVCSDANEDVCVFPSDAPWIVYAADADTAGVVEAFGVKSDLLGTMEPVKLSAKLASGWKVTAISDWSPDGSAAIITTGNAQLKRADSYLVRFGDELPTAPVFLTEGMSASVQSTVSWSPSGKTLMIRRDDGLHAVSVADDGTVAHALASGSGYAVENGWLKSDDELLFQGKNIVSSKLGFYLAVRGPSSWSQQLIAEVAGVAKAYPTPDGALLGYLTQDAQNAQLSFWVVEALAASTPHKLAGPVTDLVFSPSVDTSQLLMATTNGATGKTSVFGGTRAELLALPSVKPGIALLANEVFPYQPGTPWAPDASRAVGFQESAIGKQLVIYQPSEAETWHPLALHQLKLDSYPVWSPSSTALALATKTSADSAVNLTLVSSPDYASRTFDQTPNGGYIKMLAFSAGGEFFVYAKGSGGASTDGYYLDLRNGVAKAPAPQPIDDPIDSMQFASTGTAALYARAGKKDCNFIDFGAAVPDSVSPVNNGKPVGTCGFQRLRK